MTSIYKRKEQLKRLKSKKFPFSFHPEKIPSSQKMSQDIQKRSFGDMFLFKEGEKAILAHLKKVEMARRPKQNFMAAQQDVTVKMRLVLLDWLSEVSSSFRLGTDCLFLAAELIDLFLSKRKVTRSRFQLLGCAALFIAAKFSEIAPPVARDFVYVADSAFSHKDLYEMEILVLKNTEWSLSLPSHSVFCNHFFGVAKTNEKQRHFCWFLLELSIFETELSSTAPSTIISAALFAALHLRDQCRQESIKQSKIWRKFLANGNVGVKEKRCFEENKFLYKRFGRVSKEIAIFW
ncbi:Cyclin-A2, partial [Bonamia ostreae]